MGLFGKKKTPEEILAEGRALYDKGEYSKAALVLLKASGKENGEVDYWLGHCYLAWNEKRPDKGKRKLAEQNFRLAAEAGHGGAAQLLAERFDVRDFLPRETAAPSAPGPEPVKASAPVRQPAPASVPAPEAKTDGVRCDEDGGADEEKNLRWYEKAAGQGIAEGMMDKSVRRGSTMEDYLKYYTVQGGDKELFCVDFYTDHPKIEEIGDNVNGGLGLSPWDWLRFFHAYLRKRAPELLKDCLVEIDELDDDCEEHEGVRLWGQLTDEHGFSEPGQAEIAENLVKMIRSLMENEEEIYRIMGEIKDE